jgi:hypothetical protein
LWDEISLRTRPLLKKPNVALSIADNPILHPSAQPIILLEKREDSHATSLTKSRGSQDTWPELFKEMQDLVSGEVEALANIFESPDGACVLADQELSRRNQELQKAVEGHLAPEPGKQTDCNAQLEELWQWPPDLEDDGVDRLRQIKVQLRIRLKLTGDAVPESYRNAGIDVQEWIEDFTCRQSWAFYDPNAMDDYDDGTASRQGSVSNPVPSYSGVTGTNLSGTTRETSRRSMGTYLKSLMKGSH